MCITACKDAATSDLRHTVMKTNCSRYVHHRRMCITAVTAVSENEHNHRRMCITAYKDAASSDLRHTGFMSQ
jgi:hypothetical protein